MSREDHLLLALLVEVVMDLQASSGSRIPGLVVGRRRVLNDAWMG